MPLDVQTFNAALAEIASEGNVRAVLRDMEIDRKAFYESVNLSDENRSQYARAKDMGVEAFADETIEIADDETLPADSRRIRVDVRKWHLSKIMPKRYGDKLDVEHSGGVIVEIHERG